MRTVVLPRTIWFAFSRAPLPLAHTTGSQQSTLKLQRFDVMHVRRGEQSKRQDAETRWAVEGRKGWCATGWIPPLFPTCVCVFLFFVVSLQELLHTCYETYVRQPLGLAPEITHFNIGANMCACACVSASPRLCLVCLAENENTPQIHTPLFSLLLRHCFHNFHCVRACVLACVPACARTSAHKYVPMYVRTYVSVWHVPMRV